MSIAQPGGIASAIPPRHVLAQLATGGFLLLAGALFAAPFLLNPRAQENDVFLTNLFLAPLLSLLGNLLYLIALRRLGLSLPLLLALVALNLVAITSWLWLPPLTPQGIPLTAVMIAVDAVLLFVIGALVAAAHGLRSVWAQGILLAIAAGASLAVIYGFFGGQYLAFGETTSSLPPYVNITALLAAAGIAIMVYLLGWFRGRVR